MYMHQQQCNTSLILLEHVIFERKKKTKIKKKKKVNYVGAGILFALGFNLDVRRSILIFSLMWCQIIVF